MSFGWTLASAWLGLVSREECTDSTVRPLFILLQRHILVLKLLAIPRMTLLSYYKPW